MEHASHPQSRLARPLWQLSAPRISAIVAASLYVGLFHWGYVSLIAPRYTSWGLMQPSGPAVYLVISALLAVLPSCWLPIALTRPSQVILHVTYLIIYVPFMIVAYGVASLVISVDQVFELCLLVSVGMAIISAQDALPLRRIARPRIEFRLLLSLVVAFAAVLLAAFFATQWQYIHFTLDFREIYNIRAALTERVETSGSRFVFYAQNWLAGFAFPLLFAIGAYRRHRILVVASLIAPVFLYTVNGLKGMLFCPVYFLAVYFTCRWARTRFAIVWSAGLVLGCAIGLLIDPALGLVGILYSALLQFRTLSVPAQLLVQYLDFFSTHPVTLLSHVQGVSTLIQYPYAAPLPEVIGTYYYGPTMKGANAGFWATDGIAAFGAPGIIISSILMAIVMYTIDCLAIDVDPRLAATALSYTALFLASTSIFTTLLTGGLGMLMVVFWLWPSQRAEAYDAVDAAAEASPLVAWPV